MQRLELDVVVTRGPVEESRHRVHASVRDATGATVAEAGDPSLVTCWRSCAKPFQVLPNLAAGTFDTFGWGPDEVALACGSHGGEPEHVAVATRMLSSLGLEEGDLACGPHEPLSRRGVKLLRESGASAGRLHNNCSGKHAAMIAFAMHREWPALGYERLGHQVQQAALEEVSRWSGVSTDRVMPCVDGCGVVAFGLPLEAMALAFARLGAAAERGEECAARVVSAMTTRPFLGGGTDRFDTVLMDETSGRVVAKVGAEGVHSVALPAEGLGFALKVTDGAARAQHAAVLRLLQILGVFGEMLPSRLAPFATIPVINTRGEVVGEVRAVA